MSAITKQWLQSQISAIKAVGITDSNTLQAFEIALASLEAEPVAWRRFQETPMDSGYWVLNDYKPSCSGVESLYTAPPAPVSVPECFTNAVSALELLYRNGQKQNWNERYTTDMAYASGVLKACRAAMLQGAEPVTTAYKLPANTPCKDAPEHIWLQTSGVWPENGEFSELTWCSDNQHPDDTLYVRADVVSGNSPVIPDEVLSAVRKVARIRADFDYFDGDRRGIGDCLDEAEQELIVTINKHASAIAAAPQQEVKP